MAKKDEPLTPSQELAVLERELKKDKAGGNKDDIRGVTDKIKYLKDKIKEGS